MNQLGFPILSLITFLPAAGAVLLYFIDDEDRVRWTAFLVSLATFVISLMLPFTFDLATAEPQFVEKVRWIPQWGISYHLGVDGLSLLLVLLTTFLSPLALLSTWEDISDRVKGFNIFMLLLETGMIGVFMALDFFLFYIFWEFTLVPMYFLVGMWGGPRRVYAAIKFFLYTMAGSILMLLAILALALIHAQQTGIFTFDVLTVTRNVSLDLSTQMWLFIAFFAAFAIKVPLWPFHSWLPDAHVEAPTAGSVILAGILLKMGGYGFIRFNLPLFPDAARAAAPAISILAVIGIIYGAAVSFAQRDIKKLVAYSSVSHLGFVVLGIFALNRQGLSGGILQMVNHGLSTGALFLAVGMIYERRHTREMSEFGGLWKVMPVYGAGLLVVTLSSMGLPGLNGFVGEFVILLGAFRSNWIFAAFAVTGIILAAVYLLWMFQQVMLGEVTNEENRQLRDLNPRELAVLVPIIVMIFWIGLYPKPFFAIMDASVQHLLTNFQ